MEFRLQRVIRATSFDEQRRERPSLRYWLSRPPEERVAADLADIDALEPGSDS